MIVSRTNRTYTGVAKNGVQRAYLCNICLNSLLGLFKTLLYQMITCLYYSPHILKANYSISGNAGFILMYRNCLINRTLAGKKAYIDYNCIIFLFY